MFFWFSKILAFLIMPIVWIAVLMLLALLSKDMRRKRKLLFVGLVLLLVFSNSFLLDNAMRLWEVKAVKESDVTGVYDVGIVLGGMILFDSQLDRIQFSKGTDRILQAVQLYKDKKIRKILITSGSGSISYPEIKEAPILKRYLLTLNIPEEDIILESESKNTRENALFTSLMLKKELPNARCLLITSAFHMRRGIGCFKQAGIEVTPFSTDRFSGGPRKWDLDFLFIPNVDAFQGWTVLIHEVTGYLIYKISGYD